MLAAKLIIDAVATNSTDLGELDVATDIHFFRSLSDMQATSSSGLAVPTFSSGEQIWVRHSFLVDAADVAAYRFTLQRAWVCWSPVADFTPTVNPGTGCSQDIPGVMEAALGHRFLLYNISVGGIADTPASGPTQKSRIWGWSLVAPTSADWADQETVHNGFGINALPLASVVTTGEEDHRFFFHLVSEVSQAPQRQRRAPSEGEHRGQVQAQQLHRQRLGHEQLHGHLRVGRRRIGSVDASLQFLLIALHYTTRSNIAMLLVDMYTK